VSIKDITEQIKAQEEETLASEVVVEELTENAKEKIEKKDDFIEKTIEAKRNSVFTRSSDGERKRGFARSVSADSKDDEPAKEKKSSGYDYGYGYGYGYGYQKKEEKKQNEEGKEKAEKVFKEASKRVAKETTEDIFVKHKKLKNKKEQKAKDSFGRSLLEAFLEASKTLIEILGGKEE